MRRGMIVVPASLKGQWLREWSTFTGVPVHLVDGPREDRLELYRRREAGFLILNDKILLRDLEELLALEPDLMILDEAHRMKNWASKTARSIKRFDPPYRLVLSGTPMQNRLEELTSVMEWIDDRALEPRWRLVPWHTEIRGDGGAGFAAARNLDTLRARLAGSMLRRLRHEVLDQLPGRTDTTVPIEMTDRQREEHDALTQPIVSLLSIHHLITQSGIESRIERIVRGKRALFNAVFDGTTDEIRFEENHTFLEGLEREYEPHETEQDDDQETLDEIVRPSDALPEPSLATPFDRVRIERTAEGGLRIEAPPDAAAELGSMFEGMARLFRSAVS